MPLETASEKLYFYTVRQNNTSFVYARTFINSYERAEEYQSRYEEGLRRICVMTVLHVFYAINVGIGSLLSL